MLKVKSRVEYREKHVETDKSVIEFVRNIKNYIKRYIVYMYIA